MKKITILFLLLGLASCLCIFVSGDLFAQILNGGYSDGEELVLQISDNTTVRIDGEALKLLKENKISIDEFKEEARQQVEEFLKENNLALSKDSPPIGQHGEPSPENSYDQARYAEAQGRGVPLPVAYPPGRFLYPDGGPWNISQ